MTRGDLNAIIVIHISIHDFRHVVAVIDPPWQVDVCSSNIYLIPMNRGLLCLVRLAMVTSLGGLHH